MTGLEAVLLAGVHAVTQALPLVPGAAVAFVLVMRALVRGGALDGLDR